MTRPRTLSNDDVADLGEAETYIGEALRENGPFINEERMLLREMGERGKTIALALSNAKLCLQRVFLRARRKDAGQAAEYQRGMREMLKFAEECSACEHVNTFALVFSMRAFVKAHADSLITSELLHEPAA